MFSVTPTSRMCCAVLGVCFAHRARYPVSVGLEGNEEQVG